MVDWERHTAVYKVPPVTVHVRAQTTHEVKEIVCRVLRRDFLDSQIWGRVQKNVCCFECSNEHSGTQSSLNGRRRKPAGFFLPLATRLD